MKPYKISFLIIICLILFIGSILNKSKLTETFLNDSPVLKVKELQPEVFASGIVSEAGYRLHSYPTFSPDGREFYFAIVPPEILVVKQINGKYTKPETASFSEGNIQSPLFSKDGNRIYFHMTRSGGYGSLDIWYVEKEDNNWSIPYNLGSPPNTEGRESHPSFTSEGDVYFVGFLKDSGWDQGIYCSRFNNGNYTWPELLSEPVNSPYIDAYPFIAPDGSFLLFSSSRPFNEEKDLKLFVSFRDKNNNWNEPVNISEKLGLHSAVRFGSVSPDNKYLFYLMDNIIYMVDLQVIWSLNENN